MLGIMTGWRWVVFDLDGTVVNTIPLIIASYDHALWRVLNEHPDPAEARSWVGETLRDTFDRRYPERADELIAAYVEFNLRELPRLVEQFAGVAELLSDLAAAGLTVGVATSKRRHSAVLTLASVGLGSALDLTVAMEDTELHKPNPEPLRLAVERLGADPSRTVYIGDAAVDVLAARAAALDVIAVTWGAGLRAALAEAQPTAMVDTVDQLRALLLP